VSASVDFDRLVGGESVTFDIESNPRGPRAANVAAAE
jgi:cold shock CspA family protein